MMFDSSREAPGVSLISNEVWALNHDADEFAMVSIRDAKRLVLAENHHAARLRINQPNLGAA